MAAQFYAKGAFASPLMTRFEGPRKGIVGTVCLSAFMLNALLLSLVDWPVRSFSKGAERFLSWKPFALRNLQPLRCSKTTAWQN